MGLTVGAGCGVYHHGPEILTFMGYGNGTEVLAGADIGMGSEAAMSNKLAAAEVADAELDNDDIKVAVPEVVAPEVTGLESTTNEGFATMTHEEMIKIDKHTYYIIFKTLLKFLKYHKT